MLLIGIMIIILIIVLGVVIAHFHGSKDNSKRILTGEEIYSEPESSMPQANGGNSSFNPINYKDYAFRTIGKRHTEAAEIAKESIQKILNDNEQFDKLQENINHTLNELENAHKGEN